MSQKSNYLENAVINHFLRNSAAASPTAVYVALSTADPTEDGSGIVEPTGDWYARQAVTFDAPVDGVTTNSAEVDYTNGGNDRVTAEDDGKVVSHMGIFDAATNGNMLYYGPLTTPKTLNTDDEVKFPVGALQVSEL